VNAGLSERQKDRNCGYAHEVPTYRLKEVGQLLGVSDDTVRRWAERGRFATAYDDGGHRVVEGPELARFAQELAATSDAASSPAATSARNRIVGLVTRVVRDTVMAQVEMQAGPYRLVSLMSREAADELGLEPGVLAAAVVKSTNVVVETVDRQ
jgi:molybdopterin-binding protein